MNANELDQKFDDGNSDILEHFDLTQSIRPGLTPRRINVDFPEWMLESLDQEAKRLGVTRQSLIKFWIAEKIKAA
jgi:hypothetical protein